VFSTRRNRAKFSRNRFGHFPDAPIARESEHFVQAGITIMQAMSARLP
jgi:hypothetical protein